MRQPLSEMSWTIRICWKKVSWNFSFKCHFVFVRIYLIESIIANLNDFLDCEDPLMIWWSNLFSIDASWLLGDDATADKLFEHLRKIPKALREANDPLARTAVTIFCAKKLLAWVTNCLNSNITEDRQLLNFFFLQFLGWNNKHKAHQRFGVYAIARVKCFQNHWFTTKQPKMTWFW